MSGANDKPIKLSGLAGTPIEYRAPDGQVYKMSPLTPADFAEIEREREALPYRRLRRALTELGDIITADERSQMIAEAGRESARADIDSDATAAWMGSIEGAQFILYLSARKCHPDITREQAAGLVTFENLDEVQRVLDRASGVGDDAAGESVKPQSPAAGTETRENPPPEDLPQSDAGETRKG
jgi:hypothetical protein